MLFSIALESEHGVLKYLKNLRIVNEEIGYVWHLADGVWKSKEALCSLATTLNRASDSLYN